MKVLLKEDVNNLGYAGEVMEVADGYGRNYLIPRGIAVKVTPSVLKSAETWRDRAAIRMQEVKKEHKALAERIEVTTLEFIARAGDTGKLYGSITTADIVEQLNEVLGTEIDRKIIISDPLRQLGEHQVTVRLSRDFQPAVTVFVKQFEEEVQEVVTEDEVAEEEPTEMEDVATETEALDETEDIDSEPSDDEVDEADEEEEQPEIEGDQDAENEQVAEEES